MRGTSVPERVAFTNQSFSASRDRSEILLVRAARGASQHAITLFGTQVICWHQKAWGKRKKNVRYGL